MKVALICLRIVSKLLGYETSHPATNAFAWHQAERVTDSISKRREAGQDLGAPPGYRCRIQSAVPLVKAGSPHRRLPGSRNVPSNVIAAITCDGGPAGAVKRPPFTADIHNWEQKDQVGGVSHFAVSGFKELRHAGFPGVRRE